jgi:thiol-disulfide isomerase/thioredoxin
MSERFDSSSGGGESKKNRRWLRWARDIALLLLIVAAVQWWQSRHLAQDVAPPLVGLLVDGTPFQLSPGSSPILVHFWAEWCPICRLGQDSIERIAQDHRVMTVAMASGSPADVQEYLDQHELTMPVLVDQDGRLASTWGVRGVPATFIVDRDGRIVHASQGYSTEWGLRLRLWWTRLAG